MNEKLQKLFFVVLVWFPIVIVFVLSDQKVMPYSNTTHSELDTVVCERLSDSAPFAKKNFIISFFPMIFPTFIAVCLRRDHFVFQYETVETLLFVLLLVLNTVAEGLFFGFSVANSDTMQKSAAVWLVSFLIAKTLSKIPFSDFGKISVFWILFLFYGIVFDLLFFGLSVNYSEHYFTIIVIIAIVELVFAKWVTRRALPIYSMIAALCLFFLSSVCFIVDSSENVVCDPTSPFQWLVCGRAFQALAFFVYFISVRQQERNSAQLVTNRFEEVATDDEQLI